MEWIVDKKCTSELCLVLAVGMVIMGLGDVVRHKVQDPPTLYLDTDWVHPMSNESEIAIVNKDLTMQVTS